MELSRLARIIAIVFVVLAVIMFFVGGPWAGCLIIAAVSALVSALTGPTIRL